MAKNTPASTNDRVITIVLLVVGAVITLIWFPFSLMAVMMSDSGINTAISVGIFTLILGPAAAVITLGVIAIVRMSAKKSAWVFGLLTAIAPIVMIVLGFVIAAAGATNN
jgi:hypothetical protein